MQKKRYDVEMHGNTKVYRTEFGKSIQTNEKVTKSMQAMGQATAAIDGPLGGIASRITAVNSLFSQGNIVLAGFAVSLSAVSFAVANSLSVFNDYERQQLRTEALVRATGSAAGFTAEQLGEQADAVALGTLASVQGISEAQGVLLTFKAVSGDVFSDAIRLSQDMAASFGGAARDKALQLGKALEDPANGLNALRRSGVSFTEAEKDMIAAMQDAGDMADAQRYILKKLEEQVGGSGAAEAGGLAGAVDTLSQRWDELLLSFSETTGTGSGVTKFINRVARGMNKVSEWINGTTDRTERLNELFVEHGEVLEKIERNQANEVYKAKLNARRKAILEEIELLNQKTIAEGDAHKASFLNQKELTEQAAADKEKAEAEARQKEEEREQQKIQRIKERDAKKLQSLASRLRKENDLLAQQNELNKAVLAEQLTADEAADIENLFRKESRLRENYEQQKALAIENKEELLRIEQDYQTALALLEEEHNLRRQARETESFEAWQNRLSEQTQTFGELWAQTFDRFSSGVSNSMANAITSGDSVGDAAKNVLKQVINSVLSGLIQIGIQRLALAAIETGIVATGTATNTAAAITQGAASATAWAPAAAYASLATGGANAIPASAGITSTVALTKGLALLPGFREGGYTGNGGLDQISGYVHGQEFVVNASATARHRDVLEAMNSGAAIFDHKKGQGVASNQNIAVNITIPGEPGADFMDNFARNEKRIVRTLKTALNRPY